MRVTSPYAPEIQRLLTAARTVDRLESLQIYHAPEEHTSFEQFLSGNRADPAPTSVAWADFVRDSSATFRRLHAVTEPLRDFARYRLMCAYPLAAEASEEIAILPITSGAWPFRQRDFWLIDDTTLVALEYSGSGAFEHADVLTAEALVGDARAVFARVWGMAQPLQHYLHREGIASPTPTH
ncbi:DUF6879 family protein [Nocardiopsis tropica]|uniref:DUF6879 family protein n=1 Tax=Nocardiopsis tropica TaxID=109330 RepID=UPI0031E0D7CF